MREFFRLIGDYKISEGRRDEFNGYAMKLLDLCGIRFLTEMTIDGDVIEVTRPLSADEEGIVRFNYSILEKSKKDECRYDMNTCEVEISDIGMNEFGLAIMLLMVLQESYSETPCYLGYNNEIQRINMRAKTIEYILGIKPAFPHRADAWQTLLVCRKYGDLSKVDLLDVFDWTPKDYEVEYDNQVQLVIDRDIIDPRLQR